MFAQLGSIQFNTIKTFGSFSDRGSMNFAEHKLLDGKAKLQPTGPSLTEVSISIYFDKSFCNPKDEVDALKAARDNAEILPLLWGNGIPEGDFVITDIEVAREEISTEGTLLGCSVNLSLKEFVIKDRLQQEQADNRANAKAVGNKKPVAKKEVNKSTCPQMVSGLVSKIKANASVIDRIYQFEGGPGQPVQKDNVRKSCKAISSYCASIVQSNGDCLTDDIRTKAGTAKSTAENLAVLLADASGILYSLTVNKTLQQNVKDLEISARSNINQAITRK